MKKLKTLAAFSIILSMLLMHLTIPASAATGTQPVNPNASDEAKELLQTLYNIRGHGIITGMYNWHAVPEERTNRLHGIIGEYAGIWKTDFGSGDDTYGPAEMVNVRNNVIYNAINHHNAGDIISLMWHSVKPSDSESAGWGSVQGSYTDAEYDQLLTPGTTLHNQYLAQIDDIAGYLKELRDRDIPVLWRPYHECNGGWFWWGGKNGGDRFIQLWRLMYDRYTNYHGLDNLIWVWNVAPASTQNMLEYYPGNAYVDVLTVDIYSDPYYDQNAYNSLKTIANGKPIAIGECGVLPDMNYLKTYQPDYVFFVEWADFITDGSQTDDWIRTVYHDSYCYNRGDIPTNLPDVDGPGILPDIGEVTATVTGTDSITLQWIGFEPDAAGYKIFLNNAGGTLLEDVWVQNGQGGSATISGLQPDTEYTFFLQPYAGAESGWVWINNTRTITARTEPIPVNPSIDSISANETSISVELADVNSFSSNVIRIYNTENNNTLVTEQTFTGTSVTVSGLDAVTTYSVSVSAADGSWGPLQASIQTPGVVAYDVTTDSISLKWNDFFPDKALYKVMWGNESRDVYDCTITITDLIPNTEYNFTIVGVDSNWGWSGGTRSVSATTDILLIPALDSVTAGDTALTFNMVDVLDDASNHIKLYDLDNGNVLVYDANFTGPAVTINNLTSATEYHYEITSNSGAFSAFTGDVETTGVKVVDVTYNTITLKWHDFFPDKALYKVMWGNESRDVYDCTITITGLAPDTDYNFTIVGVDSNWGWSGGTRSISVTTDEQPTGLWATNVTSNSVSLQWDDFFPNKVFYKLMYNVNGQDVALDIFGLQETITGLSSNTTYTFNVWAVDSNWSWVANRSFTVTTK